MLRLLFQLAASEGSVVLRHRMMTLAYYAAALVLGLAAFAFMLMGVHAWLSLSMSWIAASFALAAGLLLLAVIVAGIGAYVGARRRRREQAALAAAATLLAAPLAARVAASKASLGLIALAGVAVAGAALGRKLGGS